MKKINFAFGIHCHQPVGNFDFVFDDAYRRAYQPFLDVVEKYPEFKINIHYTGILLDWIRKHYPGHIAQLAKMVKSGQAEMLSGGFYEPILPVIPEADRIGQIRMLSDWVNEHLKYSPRGMWLAERVWEPTLPTTMRKAGMEYTVIDDAHFKYSGLQSDELLGYYLTEDCGNPVRIFPISQKLRYTIPFQPPEETVVYLRQLASEEEDRLVVFADDGEKFGVWPGTFDYVYGQDWLDRFLRLILDNRDWIRLVHFSEALDTIKPLGRIYLPTASYAEMMHWALPPKAFQEYEDFENYLKQQGVFDRVSVFVRGGFWRNFLAKYPESNQMHKKMLYLSKKAQEIRAKSNSPLITRALDHIWAGQCNCPYWHGVFGGLYLGHIRDAIYKNLLQAEKLLRQAAGEEDKVRIIEMDLNRDGFTELLIETPRLNVYLDPEKGGQINELDYLPANFNLLNTVTRREEGYHRKLLELAARKANQGAQQGESVASIHDMVVSKEDGLETYLNYDFHERKSLIDHFLGEGTTLKDFRTVKYREEGDFVAAPYRVIRQEKKSDRVIVQLRREGVIRRQGQSYPVIVQKTVSVSTRDAVIEVHYQLRSDSREKIPLWFGVEFNFSLLAGYADDRYYISEEAEIAERHLASTGELEGVKHLGLVDEYDNIRIDLHSSRPAKIWRFPIETVSLSESGFERVYQSSVVLYSFPIELNNNWEVKIRKNIAPVKA